MDWRAAAAWSGPLSLFRLYKHEAYLLLIFHSRLPPPSSSLMFPAPPGRVLSLIIWSFVLRIILQSVSTPQVFH